MLTHNLPSDPVAILHKRRRPACRELFAALIFCVVACLIPADVGAQAPSKVPRIGWMSRGDPTVGDSDFDAFRKGMRDLGYVEGQTFLLEPRYAGGKDEMLLEHAAELERSGVDVIIAGPFAALQAAKLNTTRVPIIMTPSADPVATGIVRSLHNPGGRISGITEMMPELTPVRLKFLKQIIPTLSRAAILWAPGTLTEAAFTQMLRETLDTARALGVRVQVIEVTKAEDFEAAFAAMVKERAEAFVVLVNPMFSTQRRKIIEGAARHNLPAIYEWKSFVQGGGLISYGADVSDVYRRAAGFVDKILKGADPANLPVEGPTLTDMAVNLTVAKALGIVIPDSIIKSAVLVIK